MTPEQIRDLAANVAPRLNRSESGTCASGVPEQIMLLAEIAAQLAELNGTMRQLKHKRLAVDGVDPLWASNPTFYGLGPNGQRRALEKDDLAFFEPNHNYSAGFVVTEDGTRMAVSQARAREAGWEDVAALMAEKGIQ